MYSVRSWQRLVLGPPRSHSAAAVVRLRDPGRIKTTASWNVWQQWETRSTAWFFKHLWQSLDSSSHQPPLTKWLLWCFAIRIDLGFWTCSPPLTGSKDLSDRDLRSNSFRRLFLIYWTDGTGLLGKQMCGRRSWGVMWGNIPFVCSISPCTFVFVFYVKPISGHTVLVFLLNWIFFPY